MPAPKFQPAPPHEQVFLDGDKPSKAWYQWFTLLPPRLTSPAVGSTPASSAANGIPGQISFDQNFLYICVATNTWKRLALSAF
ncbi:MAG TPA: hypothetical protein VMQ17_08775 [Candidatus Sulfotelmatobacter sp.]|nr:hypothetical protein [Candidatus Sulfotelmatobacter sp.]